MTREQKMQISKQKCADAGCNGEQAKRHFDLLVNHEWDVHPSGAFLDWFNSVGDLISGSTARNNINPITAWNAVSYRARYDEARAAGAI